MSEKTTPVKQDDVITINLQPFLMPMTILLSVIIFTSGMFFGLNNIATSIRGVTVNAGSTTSTTTGTTTTPTPQPTTAQTTVTLSQIKGLFDGTHIQFGDANKKVLFVEFSDPSCPYCHIAGGKDLELNKSAGAQFAVAKDGGSYVPPVPEIKKLVDSGEASFVWIYLNGHGNGEMGTRALYCGYEMGKFWQVHDLLMSREGYKIQNGYDIDQKTIDSSKVVGNDKTKSALLADFLKTAVDPTQMKTCLDSGKYDSKLTDDVNLARNTFGVQGTPGFFVNATSYPGAYGWTDMKATVDTALAQ